MIPFHFSARFLALATAALAVAGPVRAEEISFADDVMPILKIRCMKCHQPEGEGFAQSGLDMRTYDGVMRGTKHGPIVIPGDSIVSNLNVLVEGRADPRLRMPHNGKRLTRCEIDILRRWVNRGARNN